MKARLFGLVLLAVAVAGFVAVARHAAQVPAAEAELWELLLSPVAVPFAAVGLPVLIFGAAIFTAGKTRP